MTEQNTGNNGDNGENDERNPRRFWPAVINVINSRAAYYRAQIQRVEDPQPVREGPAAWLTAGGTCLAAILAGVAAYVFWCQLGAMQDQLDEMRAEQRPWVYAEAASPDGPFYRNQSGGFTLDVGFTLHNTGHLPALYVSPDIDGYLPFGKESPRDWQRRHCAPKLEQPKAMGDQIGVTVFPGQTVHSGRGAGFKPEEIDALKRKWRKNAHKEMDHFIAWVVGCIRYRAPDGSFHQTGVAYQVGRGGDVLPPDPTGVPTSEITLDPWIAGGMAYSD
jgi:hypothetical protein